MRLSNFELGLLFFAGALAIIYTAMRADDRRNKSHIWAGWRRCHACRGLYPDQSSNTPGYCSSECKEIEELDERLAQIQ